jgi:hypothetical protein
VQLNTKNGLQNLASHRQSRHTRGALRASLHRCGLFTLLVVLLVSPSLRAAPPFSATANALPRARVVTISNPAACETFVPRPEVVHVMVERALTNLTGKPTVPAAWRSLVSTQDVVGIKVFSRPGPHSGTRPAVVAAVVETLVAAGVPPKHIVLWDKETVDLHLAGFFELANRYGVRVAGSAQAGYDPKAYYENPLLGNLVWGDLEFEKKGPGIGRKSFISRLLTQDITKIVNITPLLNHNLAGVSGCLYSLATGSADNLVRFESDARLLAEAVPDIYNQPELSDHVVLNIVDGLICQYEGAERSLLHYSVTLNELRFSRDPVALDVLSLQELERQRQAAQAPEVQPNHDLYSNASLAKLGISDLHRIQVEKMR